MTRGTEPSVSSTLTFSRVRGPVPQNRTNAPSRATFPAWAHRMLHNFTGENAPVGPGSSSSRAEPSPLNPSITKASDQVPTLKSAAVLPHPPPPYQWKPPPREQSTPYRPPPELARKRQSRNVLPRHWECSNDQAVFA